MIFSPAIISAIKTHALEEFPKESVGFVANDTYYPMVNVHDDPLTNFLVDPDAYLQFESRLQAVIHSHPNGPDYPTAADMQGQIATAVPWGIVMVQNGVAKDPFFWGDQLPIPPLLGREFRHGVTDCYALVRDYYKTEKQIELPNVPRDFNWWAEGKDLYTDHFRDAGFEIVSEPEEGDGFLAQINSKVVNHAGIYMGNGLILHHLVNRLSRKEPAFSWSKCITTWARYRGP